MKRVAVLILIPLFGTGCVPTADGPLTPSLGCPELSPADFVGTYKAYLPFEAVATIELRADRTFAERIVLQTGKSLESQGTWEPQADYITIGPVVYDMKDPVTPMRDSAGLPVRCSMRKLSEFGIDEFEVYVRQR